MIHPLVWVFFEALAVFGAAVLAFAAPQVGSKWFGKVERAFREVARRRRLSILLVALVALLGRAALLPLLDIPTPQIQDEFGYLLSAHTFASGRLTNPPHPMWIHFETAYVLQQPTYMSIFPPGQGLVLALGIIVFGHPWGGVWLSVGAMCAAICWMLQRWMPAGWALLGGLLIALRLGIFSYWMNSYWGAAVAATAGALVLGAVPGIMRRARVWHAVMFGLGLVILANTRLYEGLVFALPIGIALLSWLWAKNHLSGWAKTYRIILPIALILGLGAVATSYYWWRVTGNPFRPPYTLYKQTYGIASHFVFEPTVAKPPIRLAILSNLYDWAANSHRRSRTLRGALIGNLSKARDVWVFFFGPALSVPLLALFWIRKDRRLRFLLLICATMVVGLAVEVYVFPHYVAPLTGVIMAVVLQSMRHLRLWTWHSKPTGLFLVRAIPAVCLLMFFLRVSLAAFSIPLYSGPWDPWLYSPPLGKRVRVHFEAELAKQPGRHLVLVRYQPELRHHWEWVYNEPDIDRAKVVWAREMDVTQNEELIRYFHDRHVWLGQPDEMPPKLLPYLVSFDPQRAPSLSGVSPATH